MDYEKGSIFAVDVRGRYEAQESETDRARSCVWTDEGRHALQAIQAFWKGHFCAVLLSINKKSKASIQYNKIPLVKKDYDSTKIYRKTHKKGASQAYDTPGSFLAFHFVADFNDSTTF